MDLHTQAETGEQINIMANRPYKIKILGGTNPLFLISFFSIVCFAQKDNQDTSKRKIKNNNILFYEIKTDDSLKNKILRLETFPSIPSVNINQNLISFDFCKSIDECDKNYVEVKGNEKVINHQEMSGYISRNDSLWLHPPRSQNFRILELNAFPFYINNKKKWDYSLTFGDYWSDKKWLEWDGDRTSNSIYTLDSKIFIYKFQNKKIKCSKIKATTLIENLGKTSSIFYYNEDYGFVRMIFTTINNKVIEFNLIKVLNDSNPK